jgi:stage V sporulation protein AC
MTTTTKGQQNEYATLVSQHRPARPMVKNTIRAFIVGGAICLIGQGITAAFIRFAHFSPQAASNPTVGVLILLAVILTALGVYDKFAQWAGAGSAVPVTGFANSMSSAAIECRSEGWVTGVGGNMFKLAGSVIVYGVVSAFFVALIRYILTHV